MKSFLLVFLAFGLTPLLAQERPKPAPIDAATALATAAPDENSPFFLQPVSSANTLNVEYAGSDPNDVIAGYPKAGNSEGSASSQVKKFFGNMFSSVNIGPIRTPPTTEKLEVDPSSFSLQDRREVNVTYTIRNNTKKISRLEFPTTQRIDILTYDSKGIVVDRWSDDRAFQPEEGIVIINPRERIEYQEKIPTREMKAGEAYRVETFTTGSEKFRSTKTVSPQ